MQNVFPYCFMNNIPNVSLDNLNSEQEYDFLNVLSNHDSPLKPPIDNDYYDDSLYNNIQLKCKYFDENQFIDKHKNLNKFSYLSFNIQSLPAKFSDFQGLINNLQINNCAPDVILLQETWRITHHHLFNLDGYRPLIFKSRTDSQGGGTGIYVKTIYRFNVLHAKSVFIDRILESLFIELWLTKNKKIILGSVYRPATNHPTLSSSEQFNPKNI